MNKAPEAHLRRRAVDAKRHGPVHRVAQLLVITLAFGSVALALPTETPNDAETIREVRKDLMSWADKLVAFRVRVLEVHAESRGQPLLKVSVGDAKGAETFWIGSLVTDRFVPGNDVLVLGLMVRTPTKSSGLRMANLVKEPFMVLGFCFLNITENWGAGEKEYWQLCDEWFENKMPATPADP